MPEIYLSYFNKLLASTKTDNEKKNLKTWILKSSQLGKETKQGATRIDRVLVNINLSFQNQKVR